MASLNLAQDVANKRERVANFYSLQLAVRMRRYSSLIIINPST